jgi:hypothetical protein
VFKAHGVLLAPHIMLPFESALMSTGVLLLTQAVSGWWKVTVLPTAYKKPARGPVLFWAHSGPLMSSGDISPSAAASLQWQLLRCQSMSHATLESGAGASSCSTSQPGRALLQGLSGHDTAAKKSPDGIAPAAVGLHSIIQLQLQMRVGMACTA